MHNANHSEHAFLTTIARCLSGNWLIDPTWLYQHADQMARADRGEDMKAIWPEMKTAFMQSKNGVFQSSAQSELTGKASAMGVISLVGPIYKYGYNSSKNFLYYLNELASDDMVGSVMVKIDSPGGQNAGTREVFQGVLNFPKPLLVVVDGTMASAALYQMAGAKKIVATQPTDQIGSIGTYQSYTDWTEYYAKMGLKSFDIYAPGSTEKNEEYRQLIESGGKNSKLVEQYLGVLNDQFIADMKTGRGAKLSKDVEKGRIYFAPEAIEKGLIDEIVSVTDTFSLLADMQSTTKQSSIQMGLKEKIMQIFSEEEPEQSINAPTIEQLIAQRDAALQQVTTLTTTANEATLQVTTLNSQVSTLTTERDALQAKVTEFGEQPGAMGTRVTKTADEIPAGEGDTKTWQQIIQELPSEKEARDAGY